MADEQTDQNEETPVEAEGPADEVEAVADEAVSGAEPAEDAPTDEAPVEAAAETEPVAAPEADEPAAEVEVETPAEAAAEVEAETPAEEAAEVVAEAGSEPEAETEPEAEPAPEAESEPEAPKAPAEPEAAAAPALKKKKKKRLPRTLRPTKSRPKREASSERKPITRLPKPEHVKGRSQLRQGTVVSAAMDKTIVVRVDQVKVHPRYKKVIRRSSKFHAHDERNEAKVGDIVLIVETRPLSRMKRWRLQQIVEAAR